jgi:hypothetical protein
MAMLEDTILLRYISGDTFAFGVLDDVFGFIFAVYDDSSSSAQCGRLFLA